MGYRGKLEERRRARELRAEAWTLQEIADELGVAKSSVSVWVRDVEFVAKPRRRVAAQRSYVHPARQAKLDQIERLNREGLERVGTLSEREFLMAGIALYAGEGAKTDGAVGFANSDPELVALFCRWLRHFFDIDERRVRLRLYLHEGLDLSAATDFWSGLTGVPEDQFMKPYRAAVDGGIRNSKHVHGCVTVTYSCSATHRAIMGLVRALPRARVNTATDTPR